MTAFVWVGRGVRGFEWLPYWRPQFLSLVFGVRVHWLLGKGYARCMREFGGSLEMYCVCFLWIEGM